MLTDLDSPVEMGDAQLLRYNRQIMLPQVGIEGQHRLLKSHAVIIGLGGLGSPSSMYLAACGVGGITLVDHDTVELSNLQRQIVHGSRDLNNLKVLSAAQTLRALNPEVIVETVDHKLDFMQLQTLFEGADVVLDGTDNFAARFSINAACQAVGTALVSAAVIRMEGQVTVFDPSVPDSPCYACLYGTIDEPAETCAENGVLGPVAGLLGCIQATEAIKVLLGIGTSLTGRLMLIDASSMECRSVKLRRDPHCRVCGDGKVEN